MRSHAFPDALHASRLINIEERAFQRVSKALLGKGSTIRPAAAHYPSPPPESEDVEGDGHPSADQLQSFREHVLLDFAALESSIIRIQLIHTSNDRERQRFAAEKAKILETAQAVRDNTIELRAQLAEAQRILELRKGYDELANKILDDQKLRSRDESRQEIEKLEKEIEDLQNESGEYEGTWVTRREQYDRLTSEGSAMIRLIRGIKDEPEDGDKDEETEEGEDGKDQPSRAGSEAPDGRTPRPNDLGDSTPMPDHGETQSSTPANKFLEIDDIPRNSSRVASPLSQPVDHDADTDMMDPNVTSLDMLEQQTQSNAAIDQDEAMDEA